MAVLQPMSKRGLWDWAIRRLPEKYRDYSVSVALGATHVKVHQNAARHLLSAEHQKLGKIKGGRYSKLSAVVNCVGLALSIRLDRESIAVIPPRSNRRKSADYCKALSRRRHEMENFFVWIKRYRCVSTRYDRRPDT